MNDFLSLTVSGMPEVKKKLAKLPPAIQEEVTISVANYLLKVMIEDEVPPWKLVHRETAYGRPFFTAKQRRWFFWHFRYEIKNDIPLPWHKRRGKTGGGIESRWKIYRTEGDKGEVVVANTHPASMFLYDNERQARQLGMVGWPKIGDVMERRRKNIQSVILRAVRRGIKKAGLTSRTAG